MERDIALGWLIPRVLLILDLDDGIWEFQNDIWMKFWTLVLKLAHASNSSTWEGETVGSP